MSLAELPVGSHAQIIGIHGERLQKMKLLDMGLTPDARVVVNKVAPMGDPMEVAVRGAVLTLRRAEAELIDVDHYACALPPLDDGAQADAAAAAGQQDDGDAAAAAAVAASTDAAAGTEAAAEGVR